MRGAEDGRCGRQGGIEYRALPVAHIHHWDSYQPQDGHGDRYTSKYNDRWKGDGQKGKKRKPGGEHDGFEIRFRRTR